MSLESKIQFRIYAFSIATFIVIAILIGIIKALIIALLGFLIWKTYSYIKLKRWLNGESSTTQQMIEFANQQLNEGVNSKNFWVRTLAKGEVADHAREYRVELMARPMMIEKTSTDVIEGWTEWGSSRMQENVLKHSADELAENWSETDQQVPMLTFVISKAAFEILFAEHALKLLEVDDPRSIISKRVTAKVLSGKKSDTDIAWAFQTESTATLLGMLAKALGEKPKEAV